jgi:hypothetical protein
MKKLILAISVVASCAAYATDITVPWTSPSGAKYVYHLDSESAKKIVTEDGPIWTATVKVTDPAGTLVASANAVVDGCDLVAPGGAAAMVDDKGQLIDGTAPTQWTLAAFAAGKGSVVDSLASYTCIAAMANELAASKKKKTLYMNSMEYFMQHI